MVKTLDRPTDRAALEVLLAELSSLNADERSDRTSQGTVNGTFDASGRVRWEVVGELGHPECMVHRSWLSIWGAAVVLASLSACSYVPPTSWRVVPIEFDNALDVGPEDRIDVTYSMTNMTQDTAGGFWTESAGSRLHLNSAGDTLRRFNDEMFTRVHGISAISPSVLAVSRTGKAGTEIETGIYLYDTDAETWTPVDVDATTIGDVAAGADGRLVFVDFLGEMVPEGAMTPLESAFMWPFAIRTVAKNGQQTTVLGAESGVTAAAVAIDIDPAGTVYVSTERETFAIGADGTRSPIATYPPRNPVLAVNAVGYVLTAAPTNTDATERPIDWKMVRASSPARGVMAKKGDCPQSSEQGIRILTGEESTSLPFSCNTNGAVWLNDTTFVLSIGDESGTILARVTPPEEPTKR
ncbi:hypothetical protein E3N86_07390 [Cryobacterium sp. Hz7]|uniref:hypothetical protein n=1 Tax=Cryobacterium sp. Hz7 TaxID=1259166 RepID=UPI00106D582F|nr:hypothetical protein [Cryobacterium sp. Hz7]TFB61854.1 hypothetical protein E3N86_07390 [Cryobacterium sp. Hz7]